MGGGAPAPGAPLPTPLVLVINYRPCPIVLKILPISLVSKSHALYLLVFNSYQLISKYYPLVSIKIINENYTATSQMLLYNLEV